MTRKRKVTEKNLGIYIGPRYLREYKGRGKYGLNGGVIQVASYKGHMVLSSEPAWMSVQEIDDVIKMLRDARKVLKEDIRLSLAVANCTMCGPSWDLCERHRDAIRRYGARVARRSPRGVLW